MIETGPHICASKQFRKNESLDQPTTEIKLTTVKSIHFKVNYYLDELPLATRQCKNLRKMKRKEDSFTEIRS